MAGRGGRRQALSTRHGGNHNIRLGGRVNRMGEVVERATGRTIRHICGHCYCPCSLRVVLWSLYHGASLGEGGMSSGTLVLYYVAEQRINFPYLI